MSEWIRIKELRSIFTVVNDKRKQLKTSGYYTTGKYPIIDQSSDFICGYSDRDDVLFSSPLPIIVFGDHTRWVKYVDFPFIAGADGTQILKASDWIDSKFLFYVVQKASQNIGNFGYDRHLKHLKRYPTSVPANLSEQRKIADILSTVDEVIEKTEATIEKYQAIKAGMMQDLFTRGIDTKTGKLRPTIEEAPELYKESELGWIPKELEIVQIGDFAKIKGGKRMPAGKEFSDALTPYPYLRVTDMQDGSIDQADLKYVPVEIEPLIRSYKISVDDVYVTIAGTLGLFGTIPVNLDQAQLTENAARITEFDKLEYDRDFIKHQCNSVIVQGQVIREIGVGGGVPKLALFRIAKFLFLKPAIPEQQAIVDRIRVIENKLCEESVALTKYKQLKQGMMADLLTGIVRVEKHKCEVNNDRKSTNN